MQWKRVTVTRDSRHCLLLARTLNMPRYILHKINHYMNGVNKVRYYNLQNDTMDINSLFEALLQPQQAVSSKLSNIRAARSKFDTIVFICCIHPAGVQGDQDGVISYIIYNGKLVTRSSVKKRLSDCWQHFVLKNPINHHVFMLP